MSVGAVNKQTGERIPTAGMPAIDDALDLTSVNPVQNAIITAALANKQDKTDNNLETTSKTVVGAVNELKSGLNDVNSNITTLFSNILTAESFQGSSEVKYVVLGKVVVFYANITKNQSSWTIAYGLPKPYFSEAVVGYLEDNFVPTDPVFIYKDTSDGRLQVRSSSTSITGKRLYGVYLAE